MLLLAALLAAPSAATALPFQSTTTLDALVAEFTGVPVGSEGGARAPVDARLRLAACTAPQLEWRSELHDAVVVRCMAPAWRIYVPVATPARVPKTAVLVTAPPPKVQPVIRRGDPVTVEAGSDGFSITRDGIAMGDAPAGGRLLVRVDEKKPPIQAVAVESGRATLPGWQD